jgi:hypothetical protein
MSDTTTATIATIDATADTTTTIRKPKKPQPFREIYPVHRSIPGEWGGLPITYIIVNQRPCQLPPSLQLKPGDRIMVDRVKVEKPSDELNVSCGHTVIKKKRVLMRDEDKIDKAGGTIGAIAGGDPYNVNYGADDED